MKKVYIAGKLNAPNACDYIKNIHNMIQYSEKVRKLGFAVFVPAIDFMLGVMFGNWEYNDYFSNSQPWLECSDYVFVCPGWETSEGTKKEIKRAEELGIPVIYSIENLKIEEKVK